MSDNQVERVWEERIVSPEKGSRVTHYYLRDSTKSSLLAVVGIEKSRNHMTYRITDEFLHVMGSSENINKNTKWKRRRDVAEFLISITRTKGPLYKNPSKVSSFSELRATKNAQSDHSDSHRFSSPLRRTSTNHLRASSSKEGNGGPMHPSSRSSPTETFGTIVALGKSRASSSLTKHHRENSSEAFPRPGAGKGLFIDGLNRDKCVNSCWDSVDLDTGHEKTRALISSCDDTRFDQFSSSTLDQMLRADLERIPLMSHSLSQRSNHFEEEAKAAKEKLAQMVGQLQKLKKENARLAKELKHEVKTGDKFRKSEEGKIYFSNIEKELVTKYQSSMEKELVSNYKNSAAYREDLVKESLLVYDRTIRDCRKILRESGRYPGEDFMFLDADVSEEPDLEEDKALIPEEGDK